MIYEIAQKNISTKNDSILNLLKIKESSKNIQKFMLNIYQNYYKDIFKIDDTDINTIIKLYD